MAENTEIKENVENEVINETDLLKKQLAELQEKLNTLEKPVEKRSRGRPKKEKTDRKEYLRNYMREYNKKNNEAQRKRFNNYYYLKKSDMDKSYIEKYGNHAYIVFKTREAVKQLKNDCPQFLSDILI